MSTLLKTPADFAKQDFWQAFHKRLNLSNFEWYGNYDAYADIIERSFKPDSKILNIGCGTSALEYSMYNHGYHNVHSVDIDENVIGRKIQKAEDVYTGLTYGVVDVGQENAFEPGSFNFAVDKGTLDALLPPDYTPEQLQVVHHMLANVTRSVKQGGRYTIITLGQKHILNVLLDYFETNKGGAIRVFLHPVEELRADKVRFTLPVIIVEVVVLTIDVPLKIHVVENGLIQQMTRETFLITVENFRMLCNFQNMCKFPLQHSASVTLLGAVYSSLAYSCIVVDKPGISEIVQYGVMLMPFDPELSDMSDEDLELTRKESNMDRIVLVRCLTIDIRKRLNDDELKDELFRLSRFFTPHTFQEPVNILQGYTESSDVTQLKEGDGSYVGKWHVSEYVMENMTLRRLIFDSAPTVVQSEVQVEVLQKADGKTVVKIPRTEDLRNAYQQVMVSALKLIAKKSVLIHETPFKVAILGVGGGTLVSFLYEAFKNSHVTCVEIEPELYKIGRKFFGLPKEDGKRLRCVTGDAMDWLKAPRPTDTAKLGDYYVDALFVDLGGAAPEEVDNDYLFCPPEPFVQPETVDYYKARLNFPGIVIANVVCHNFDRVTRIANLFYKQFQHVYYSNPAESANYIVVGSDVPLKKAPQIQFGPDADNMRSVFNNFASFKPVEVIKAAPTPSANATAGGKNKKNKNKKK